MTLTTYLALALISMEVDALLCHVGGIRFRWFRALFLALVWPVTALFIVTASFFSAPVVKTSTRSDGPPSGGRGI